MRLCWAKHLAEGSSSLNLGRGSALCDITKGYFPEQSGLLFFLKKKPAN